MHMRSSQQGRLGRQQCYITITPPLIDKKNHSTSQQKIHNKGDTLFKWQGTAEVNDSILIFFFNLDIHISMRVG